MFFISFLASSKTQLSASILRAVWYSVNFILADKFKLTLWLHRFFAVWLTKLFLIVQRKISCLSLPYYWDYQNSLVLNCDRYQPEQPSLVYQITNAQEDVELSDSISAPSMDILPGVEERFSFKTLLFPENPEPSTLSGFTVNVCASFLGKWSYQAYFITAIKQKKRKKERNSHFCFSVLVKKLTRVLIGLIQMKNQFNLKYIYIYFRLRREF